MFNRSRFEFHCELRQCHSHTSTDRIASKQTLATRSANFGGKALPTSSQAVSMNLVSNSYDLGKVWIKAASRTDIVLSCEGCPNLPMHGVVQPDVIVGPSW